VPTSRGWSTSDTSVLGASATESKWSAPLPHPQCHSCFH
jgi:hypothetical protein